MQRLLSLTLIPFLALALAWLTGTGLQNTAVSAAPGDVIISEVAWGGTQASADDEWLELYNATELPISLSGWTLAAADSTPTIHLSGTLAPHAFWLLERTGDDTVSDVPADQIYTGSLRNSGETLTLTDDTQQIIDTANGSGGAWPAGGGAPDYRSMERVAPDAPDAGGWASNSGAVRNGYDAAGNPINGTPRAANELWQQPPANVDLFVHKEGPATAAPGAAIQYRLSVKNLGTQTAAAVFLTDTLPQPLTYLSHTGSLSLTQQPPYLVWNAGDLAGGTAVSLTLTAQIAISTTGVVTNLLQATTTTSDTNPINNRDVAVLHLLTPTGILIDAAYYDGYEPGDLDEAIALYNGGGQVVNLAGWSISDSNDSRAALPPFLLAPGARAWIAQDAAAFARQFGFAPDLVPASWPGFSNSGDAVRLRDGAGMLVDVLVYEAEVANQPGWTGTAVWPYAVSGVFAAEGQILYRRRGQQTGLPVPDTNGVADWAQMEGDVINGRKVRYPGWDLDAFFWTQQVTETAVLTVAVAPDNAYSAIANQIDTAQNSIQVMALTFEHVGLGERLKVAAQRGVSVIVLLEGSPIGGVPEQEKYVCQMLESAGGQCWFMISDTASDVNDRYRFLHAKLLIVDGERIAIGSENLSPNSLPDDEKGDGTWGRRGVVLITDAPGVVSHAQAIFAADLDTAHPDLLRWQPGHPTYGPPAPGFVPITVTGGTTYTVRFPDPLALSGTLAFELVQSPENSLRNRDALLGLLQRAGAGDTILVQQLAERPYWGASDSSAAADPNPRLEAYIAAARRGAAVRLLLDSFFDTPGHPTSNFATCEAVNELARREGLDLACRRANPAGLGIHNKMVLVALDGRGYVHVGSLNGTEQAHKGNRELALQVQSDAAYELLSAMFNQDWPHRAYLPLLRHSYVGAADHLLISELLYDPFGPDDAEFIELANPTPSVVDLSNYSLGDAVYRDDFEDVRRFPAGTRLLPGATVIVATSATAFFVAYGFAPDFEILDTDAAVPDLIDDPAWGDPEAMLQLGNAGDEVILRDGNDTAVDVVVYGSGSYPGHVACGLLPQPNHSLERFPFWRDTNRCTTDFRPWPFPNPGKLP